MKKRKLLNNLFILCFTAASAVLVLKFHRAEFMPFYLILMAIFIYLLWAVLYHKLDKSLTFPILVEYLLTAFLALVVLTGVFFK